MQCSLADSIRAFEQLFQERFGSTILVNNCYPSDCNNIYILKTLAKSLTFKSKSEFGLEVFTETREVDFLCLVSNCPDFSR